jgi:asparagine synthase (glutamine-hydrolysing)
VCGIVGTIGYEPARLDRALERLAHRGPDHVGRHVDVQRDAVLGHLRLSIIDLDSRSHQPFFSDCRRYSLTYNGEIYNFRELRAELAARGGHVFRTTSDTEVLLRLLIESGLDGLARVDGMFALCFADHERGRWLLARDHIGEKPLYYTEHRHAGRACFAFASEIKGLLDLPGVDRSLDRVGLADYLRFLYTAPPHTLYRGIRELPPGCALQVDVAEGRASSPIRFYDLDSACAELEARDFPEAARDFAERFTHSVRARLVSDVQVGLYLSAGIDSNAVLAAALGGSEGASLKTYTMRYAFGATDESAAAAADAAWYGVPNTVVTLAAEWDFDVAVQRVVDLFDQPFGNSTALVAYDLAGHAVRSSRVCLVGDGGDELTVGYPRYRALLLQKKMAGVPAPLRRAIAAIVGVVPEIGSLATPVRRGKQFLNSAHEPPAVSYLNWATYLDTAALRRALAQPDVDSAFYTGLLASFERFGAQPLRAAALVDMKSFVPFNLMQCADRTAMGHSLEIRSPFLARSLVESALSLPDATRLGPGGIKPLLTVPMASRLAPGVVKRPKMPFNPPIRALLRRNLAALESTLLGPDSRLGGVMDRAFVEQAFQSFQAQRVDNSTFLWGLATLDRWLRADHQP